MMILMSHKVRSRVPDAPSVESVSAEPVKARRGRPRGNGRTSEEKIHYPSVCGVDLAKFWEVPAALRNRLAAAFARALAGVFGALQDFYGSEERDVIAFLCHRLPPIVFALGRSIMADLLAEERGHLGQEIACNCKGCKGKLTYQGDVNKIIKTKMGEITVARSYYYVICGHSACPLDVRLGLDESHSALPDLLELITMMTPTLSFREAVAFVEKSITVPISLRYAEAVTETDADYIEAKLKHEVEECPPRPSAPSASGRSWAGGCRISLASWWSAIAFFMIPSVFSSSRHAVPE